LSSQDGALFLGREAFEAQHHGVAAMLEIGLERRQIALAKPIDDAARNPHLGGRRREQLLHNCIDGSGIAASGALFVKPVDEQDGIRRKCRNVQEGAGR
jgi:hypothetical protein